MKIDQYKVTVEFDLAMMQGGERVERTTLELNQLFHDMVKAWARDKPAMTSSTRTTLDQIIEARQA